MAKMKVFRDAEGAIINIGDWDYMEVSDTIEVTVPVERQAPIKLPDGGFMTDASGNMMTRPFMDEVIEPRIKVTVNNPIPEGAYEDEADIVRGDDGGLYEAGDPRLEKTDQK